MMSKEATEKFVTYFSDRYDRHMRNLTNRHSNKTTFAQRERAAAILADNDLEAKYGLRVRDMFTK